MSPIAAINPVLTAPVPVSAAAPASSGGAFGELLATSIQNVEHAGAESSQAVQQFLSGETDDLHKVALSTQRAELSSELFLQVRNKVVQAYQEIMRMQM